MWNMSDAAAKPLSLLSNCTVDTSYRFTFYQLSYSIIFLVGLAANSVVLRRLCVPPNTLNSTAVYMLSLSAADLFFVISLPLRIYYYHQRAAAFSSKTGDPPRWTPGPTYCQLTFTFKYISLYGGILFLVCIAVDRYLAVVHPLLSTLRRLRIAQLVSGGIWCLVLGLSVILPLLRSAAARQHQPCPLDPSSQHHRTVILIALVLVLTVFLLPTALLLFSYCKVVSVLRQPRHRASSQRRRRQRSLVVIYLVLAVFLLCFVPYHINLLVYTLNSVGLLTNCGLAKVTKAMHPVALTLASSNCCLNPLIYYFSSSTAHKEPSGAGCSGS